jgi:hypothetical protein
MNELKTLNNFRTFGKEQDNFDNNDTASIPVKRDVLMELTGYVPLHWRINYFKSSRSNTCV